MSILTHALKQEGKLVVVTVDTWGDQIPKEENIVSCRFRYITELDRQSHAEGVRASDAIMWFEPDVKLEEGSIVKADGIYWRVVRLIRARRMSGDEILFLKAFVVKNELAEVS